MNESVEKYVLGSDIYRESINQWLDDLENVLEVVDSAGRDALMVWEEELKAADEIDRYCAALVEC